VYAVGLRKRPGAFARQKPLAGFLLLMGGQLWLGAEADATGPGMRPAVPGTLDDALALVLRQA
jgi:hypothetical protein